ncbi:MAG: hypothetical protein ACKO0N_15080 [Planctomycetota bacterium]
MPPRRRLRELDSHSEGSDSRTETTSSEPTNLRRRTPSWRSERSPWPRRIALLCFGLFGCVLLAPNLIGWLGLQQAAIDWALADFDGKVQVRQLSLGWFQPISARGISITDGTGQPLAEIESLSSTQRLGGFLFNRNLGHFEIVRPNLRLLLRYGGSNLEDAIAKYMNQPPSNEPALLPPATLSIVDGRVEIVGGGNQETTQIEGLQVRVETATSVAALLATIEAKLADSRNSGSLAARVQLDEKSSILNMADGSVELSLDQFPVSTLGALAQRGVPRIQATGQLNGKVAMQFKEGGNQAAARLEQLNLSDALLAAPDLLGPDQFALRQLAANGSLAWQTGTATAEQFTATCDFGQVTANGQMSVKELTELAGQVRLSRAPFQLEGKLDLARVAALLPSTLHLHDDLRFESGEVQFQVLSKPQDDAARLLVNIDTTNFVARRNNQPIMWQQPLRVVADVTQRGGLPRVDQLLCRSDFLTVEGTADVEQAQLKLNGDLARLQQQLGQFVDLSGWQLAGTLSGELGWQLFSPDESPLPLEIASLIPRNAQTLKWSGQVAITNPVLGLPQQPVWTESQIDFEAAGNAAVDSQYRCGLLSGQGSVRLGNEQLQWKLSEPIVDLAAAPRYSAECNLQGSIARWLKQLRPWVDLSSLAVDGNSTLRTQAILQWPTLELRNLDYLVEQFQFVGYGLNVNEPKLQGQAQVAVDLQRALAQIADVTLTSSSLAARGERLQAGYADSALQVAGSIGFRADVNRLAGWFNLSPTPESVQYFGQAEGVLNLSSTPLEIGARFEALIPELLAAQQTSPVATGTPATANWTELLKETNVKLNGQVGLSQDFQKLTVEQLALQSNSLGLQTKGKIDDLCGQLVLDMSGTWSPNWQQINGLLGAYSYQLVQLEGRQTQAFAVRGPLLAVPGQPTALALPLDLQVQTELGWDRGQVFHLPVGPANIQATLASGVASLNTGEIPFSQGRLLLTPKIDFRPESPVATLDPGPLAENIQLSPEICRDWLKYVAPLVADATSAQGKVTITTDGVAVPLADPIAMRARGAVDLQQVTIGAGPLATQLIEAVQGVRILLKPNQTESRDLAVWMQLERQTVPFAVENRRVYHEGLAMHVKDFTIRTKGSVGMDQTLSMVAEIPIADEWIGKEPWLQGLKGQSLQIPISGTVSRPVIDTKAIQQLTMQLVQRTASNQLNNVVGEQTQKLQGKVDTELNKIQNKLNSELQNGLNGLFGPKKDK